MEKYGRARQATDDNIIRRMRFACRITKATDRHAENVINIAFARKQWLRERASLLRYTYIACVVPSGKSNRGMKMSMEHGWNETNRGKQKYWEKNIIQRRW